MQRGLRNRFMWRFAEAELRVKEGRGDDEGEASIRRICLLYGRGVAGIREVSSGELRPAGVRQPSRHYERLRSMPTVSSPASSCPEARFECSCEFLWCVLRCSRPERGLPASERPGRRRAREYGPKRMPDYAQAAGAAGASDASVASTSQSLTTKDARTSSSL